LTTQPQEAVNLVQSEPQTPGEHVYSPDDADATWVEPCDLAEEPFAATVARRWKLLQNTQLRSTMISDGSTHEQRGLPLRTVAFRISDEAENGVVGVFPGYRWIGLAYVF